MSIYQRAPRNASEILMESIRQELDWAAGIDEQIAHELDRLCTLRTEAKECREQAKKLQASLDLLIGKTEAKPSQLP